MNNLVENTVEWLKKKSINYRLYTYEDTYASTPPWIKITNQDGGYIFVDYDTPVERLILITKMPPDSRTHAIRETIQNDLATLINKLEHLINT